MYNQMRTLKVGNKYTIAAFTYMGFPYHAQFILKEIKCIGFERNADTYQLLYKKVDTKALICLQLAINKQFIIWDGLVDPDTQLKVAISTKDDGHGPVQMIKRWRMNDPRYMQRAELSVSTPPIVSNYKPTSADDRLFDICEVIN